MAAGGVDPDEDVRLVVLPPPYMVESLTSGHVDGFCVGAPWNSLAVDLGVGHILHFGCEIQARVTEKVFAVRERWASEHPDTVAALVRALSAAAEFSENPDNLGAVSSAVARRVGVEPELVGRALTGHLKVAPEGLVRTDTRYMMISRRGAERPDPAQAAWIYAQIVRWGQAPMSDDSLGTAQAVFRPDLYDAAIGKAPPAGPTEPADGIGAFAGPAFDAANIAGYLTAWRIRSPGRPRLSLVR
jgi:NitT/TauT family transport system ATP-binding protein